MNIPEDFPRQPDPEALSGAHPKIAVRLVDGKYISGYTQAELETRYDICADLVTQLIAYYHRKQSQAPARPREQLLVQMSEALEKKDWGLTTAEIAWCMNHVRVAVESYSSENHDQYAGRDVRSCN